MTVNHSMVSSLCTRKCRSDTSARKETSNSSMLLTPIRFGPAEELRLGFRLRFRFDTDEVCTVVIEDVCIVAIEVEPGHFYLHVLVFGICRSFGSEAPAHGL